MKIYLALWIFGGILTATAHAADSPQPANPALTQFSEALAAQPELDPAFIPTKRAAPPEHVLQEQLRIQLDNLKALAKTSTRADVALILLADRASICNTLWNNLQSAEVPKFTHLARTLSEKNCYLQN